MKSSKAVVWLAALIAVLALVAAGIGLFSQSGGSSFSFTTLHGQTVQVYGQGLYHYDTVASASQEKGQDVVTLFLGIPLLVVSLLLYRKGSLRGHLLLAGTLGYFLYTYGSMAFLTAYNNLFLVYVALFSASLFAFVLSLASFDLQTLAAHFSPHLPRRSIAGFLFAVGLFLLIMWLGLIVPALLRGQAPQALESTTTLVIQALDLGIIMPVAVLSGILLLKRAPLGYLLASIVLVKTLTLGTAVSAMVVGQLLAGVKLSISEIVGFPLLALIGIGLTVALLHNVSEESVMQIPKRKERKIMKHSGIRITLAVIEAVIGVGAISGGLAILAGAFDQWFSIDWLAGTPFSDYTVPGLVLLIVVGGGMLLAAAAQFIQREWAVLLSVAMGFVLLGWIACEVAIVDRYAQAVVPSTVVQQMLFPVLSLVIIGLAAILWKREYAGHSIFTRHTRHASHA